jgi:hypothetical protein
MFRTNPTFDGSSFFNEENWVGVILRGGFSTEMKWLLNILRDINPMQPGFICKRLQLPGDTQNEWRDRDSPVDEVVFGIDAELTNEDHSKNYFGILVPYMDNFQYSSHYFEAFDGTWRMHLPCDEQVDRCEYKIWAGTPEVWLKLRPYFEDLPREEPPESGPLMQAYARNRVYLTDDPDIPRNVVAGLGPVTFAADAGLGWQQA